GIVPLSPTQTAAHLPEESEPTQSSPTKRARTNKEEASSNAPLSQCPRLVSVKEEPGNGGPEPPVINNPQNPTLAIDILSQSGSDNQPHLTNTSFTNALASDARENIKSEPEDP
ncbi:hypothetical protein PHLCEN_2v10234, partial [Hermanssonia centrifuga]